MDLSLLINKGLLEIKEELNKKSNINIIKNDLLNPIIQNIIEQLYPYFIKITISIILLLILIIIIIFLNIRIIYKESIV